MRYLLLFCADTTDQSRVGAASKEQLESMERQVYDWIGKHADQLHGNSRLDAPSKAKTLRPDGNGSMIATDGPFVESGEIVGGYAILEAQDMDDAVAIAREWPIGPVEIRQLV